MRERDEARSMLNALAAQGVSVSASSVSSSSSSGAMEEAAEEAPTAGAGGLDTEVVDAIMSKCGELSKGRKGRKAPAGLLSRDLVGAFASGGDSSSTSSHTPHDSKSGITCLATPALSPNCDVVLTGGSDKKAIVSEVGSGRVVAKLLGHSKKVTCCALASGSLSALPVAVTGSADNTVKVKKKLETRTVDLLIYIVCSVLLWLFVFRCGVQMVTRTSWEQPSRSTPKT
jgi:WD40 repeat protein